MLAPSALLTKRSSLTVPAVGTATSMAALVASHTFVDLVSGSIGALLPALKDRFSLNSMQAGSIIATLAASTALAQPIGGRVADRVGHRRVAAFGAVLTSALLALVGTAPHLWMVYALIVLGGLGSAGYHPASAVLARRALPDRGQLAISLFASGGMVGMSIGPIAVLLIAAHAGLGFTTLLMIPGVVLGAVLWRLVPGDPRTVQATPPRTPHKLLRGPIGTLAAAAALAGLAATTFTAGLPMWLTESGGVEADSAIIGVTVGLFQAGAAVGGLLIGWAVSRIVPARLAFGALSLAAPLLLTVLALEPGSPEFLVTAFAAGILISASGPLIIVAAQERAPHAVAAASGIVMGLAGGAAGLAFIGIGALADEIGLRPALSVGFLASIPAAYIARRALSDSSVTGVPLLVLGTVCACGAGTAVVAAQHDPCSASCQSRGPSSEGDQAPIRSLADA